MIPWPEDEYRIRATMRSHAYKQDEELEAIQFRVKDGMGWRQMEANMRVAGDETKPYKPEPILLNWRMTGDTIGYACFGYIMISKGWVERTREAIAKYRSSLVTTPDFKVYTEDGRTRVVHCTTVRKMSPETRKAEAERLTRQIERIVIHEMVHEWLSQNGWRGSHDQVFKNCCAWLGLDDCRSEWGGKAVAFRNE